MRVLAMWLACAAALLAQAGTPVFTRIGPLDCGVRLITPTTAQHWCFLRTTTPATLPHNGVDTINISPTQNGQPFPNFPYMDTATGAYYIITWQLTNTTPGAAAISYTVVGMACTPACTMARPQTGTLQSP